MTVWARQSGGATLGVTVNGRHYGLFGPAGSSWSGLETTRWTNHPGEARHFSLAALPAATADVLARFGRAAHAHVTASRATWSYDPRAGVVRARCEVETVAREGRA